jgi:hypothetical protein
MFGIHTPLSEAVFTVFNVLDHLKFEDFSLQLLQPLASYRTSHSYVHRNLVIMVSFTELGMYAAAVLLYLAKYVSEKQLYRGYFILYFRTITLSQFYSAVLVVAGFKNKAAPSITTPCM